MGRIAPAILLLLGEQLGGDSDPQQSLLSALLLIWSAPRGKSRLLPHLILHLLVQIIWACLILTHRATHALEVYRMLKLKEPLRQQRYFYYTYIFLINKWVLMETEEDLELLWPPVALLWHSSSCISVGQAPGGSQASRLPTSLQLF